MTGQKDNYIPDGDTPRRSSAMPSRPAGEGDEDVLASIAHQHASRLGLKQAVRQDSPQADLIPAEAQPVVSPAEPPPATEVEPPVRKPIDLRKTRPGDVFHVRRAVRKSPHKSARSESAYRLIIHLAVVAALTGLAVALFFLTW